MDQASSSIGGLAGLITLAVLIFVCTKWKIRGGGFLILLMTALQAGIVSFLMMFANPMVRRDPTIYLWYFLPGAVGFILFLTAIMTVLSKEKTGQARELKTSPLRWVVLIAALPIELIGIASLLISLYARDFGLSLTMGISLYILSVMLGSTLLYVASRMPGSPNRPNLIIWISFIFIFLTKDIPLAFVLLMIYALPGGADRLTPSIFTQASLVCLACIPPALTIVGLARGYIGAVKSADQGSQVSPQDARA
jgi:hypothetical protein